MQTEVAALGEVTFPDRALQVLTRKVKEPSRPRYAKTEGTTERKKENDFTTNGNIW